MSDYRCPQCEAPNSGTASICDHCGFPLPARVAKAEAGQTPEKMAQIKPMEPQVSKPAPMADQDRPYKVFDPQLPQPRPTARVRPATAKPGKGSASMERLDSVAVEGATGSINSFPTGQATAQVQGEEAQPARSIAPAQMGNLPRASEQESQWKLVVVEGFSVGKEYLVYKDTMILGRRDMDQDVYPDIDLEDQDDGYISRKHAVLRRQNGGLVIEDLGGENGTQIDMRRIESHQWVPVAEAQVIRLGRVGLLVQRLELRDQEGEP